MSGQVIRNYVIKELLGKGSYGVVYKVIKQGIDKQFFVLKQISLLGMDKAQIDEVKCEAKILSSLTSQYIVKFYENFFEDNNLNIVMEYCDGGDLAKYLQNNYNTGKFIKEEKIWRFFIQIVIGVAYIHKRNILHRDLKTLNIFLTKDDKVKIGDLGVAKVLTSTSGFANTFVGTPYYLSPEMCEEKPYNEKSDIWAIGCILYEMSTYKHPFNAKNPASLCLKILTAQYEPIHKDFSNDLKKMIEMLLEKNYNKRPGIFDILKNPSIKSSRAKRYNIDINLSDFSNEIDNKINKAEEIDKLEVKSKVVQEEKNIKEPKVERKAGKELCDKNKKKVAIENPMKNIFMNNNPKPSLNNIGLANMNRPISGNKPQFINKTPKANVAQKILKKPQAQVKVKEVINKNGNNHAIQNENIMKDNQKEQITRDKINAFESKINQDQKKPLTPDINNAIKKNNIKENNNNNIKRQSIPVISQSK